MNSMFKEGAAYMANKSRYETWGLEMNVQRTGYLAVEAVIKF